MRTECIADPPLPSGARSRQTHHGRRRMCCEGRTGAAWCSPISIKTSGRGGRAYYVRLAALRRSCANYISSAPRPHRAQWRHGGREIEHARISGPEAARYDDRVLSAPWHSMAQAVSSSAITSPVVPKRIALTAGLGGKVQLDAEIRQTKAVRRLEELGVIVGLQIVAKIARRGRFVASRDDFRKPDGPARAPVHRPPTPSLSAAGAAASAALKLVSQARSLDRFAVSPRSRRA